MLNVFCCSGIPFYSRQATADLTMFWQSFYRTITDRLDLVIDGLNELHLPEVHRAMLERQTYSP